MIWFLYNLLFSVGFVLMLPHFLLRMIRRGGYLRDFKQRFALYPPDSIKAMRDSRHVWVHAVSVGEYNVARRYMDALRKERPEIRFVLTTTTSTGYALAESRKDLRDQLFYFPTDFPAIAGRALDRIAPQCIILTEKELWPNLIRLAHARGIPVVIINGQISEASFTGYSRLKPFTKRIFGMIDLILAQTEPAKQAYLALGARADRVLVRGTAKYDLQLPEAALTSSAAAVLHAAGMGDGRPLLVGGSTWPGEERALCRVLKTLRASGVDAGLVLVPRHAERAAEVLADIAAEGLTCLQRSTFDGRAPESARDVLLVDTTGELAAFYVPATVVYVGKSLFNHGGQNMLEPALMGKPVVVGPFTENFADVVRILKDAGGLQQVDDESGLSQVLVTLMQDRGACAQLAGNAQKALQARQGVVARSIQDILPLLSP